MKKIIIVVTIILTSGLAAFALTANKPATSATSTKTDEALKVKVQDGDMRANLATAD